MHVLWSMALILAALVVLVAGLTRVLNDLLERGPYQPPLLKDDGLSWPPSYRDATPPASSESPQGAAGAAPYASSGVWQPDREGRQS